MAPNNMQFWVALLTLVDAENRPLTAFIEAHLKYLKANGVQGVLVMGTTGEFSSFSVSERQAYLETVMAVNPGLKIMVNVGASALSDTLALQTHALQQSTIHSLLCIPPFFFPSHAINGLAAWLKTILAQQCADIPFYLYHYPKNTQVPITAELLYQYPQVAGLKDSSGDFEALAQFRQAFPNKVLWAGTDWNISKSQAVGATGVLGALANIAPAYTHQALSGDSQAEIYLKELKNALPAHAKMPAIKAVLQAQFPSQPKSITLPPFREVQLETLSPVLQAFAQSQE